MVNYACAFSQSDIKGCKHPAKRMDRKKSEILILTQFLRNIAVFSPQERKLDWFPICKQRLG